MNRWENSIYWARNFSPLLQMSVERIARFDFTAAQVLSLGTSPIDLFPALPGYVYRLRDMIGYKPAGPAFTVGGFLQPQYKNSAFSAAVNLLVAGFLDQTVDASAGATAGFNSLTGEIATQIGGKGIRLSTNGGGNYGGTGFPITLIFTYMIYPVLAQNAGGPTTQLP